MVFEGAFIPISIYVLSKLKIVLLSLSRPSLIAISPVSGSIASSQKGGWRILYDSSITVATFNFISIVSLTHSLTVYVTLTQTDCGTSGVTGYEVGLLIKSVVLESV